MKKIAKIKRALVLIVVLLCTPIAYAQKEGSFSMVAPADSTKEISLIQRIDSLEHELSYVKLSYELYTLNNDLAVLKNDINITTNNIQIDIYRQNFNYRLYKAYKDNYELNKEKLLLLQELIENKKTYLWHKITIYPYSENEKNLLLSSYMLIDNGYSALESSLKLMKVCLDIYKESL